MQPYSPEPRRPFGRPAVAARAVGVGGTARIVKVAARNRQGVVKGVAVGGEGWNPTPLDLSSQDIVKEIYLFVNARNRQEIDSLDEFLKLRL
jgi:hypothetical protein